MMTFSEDCKILIDLDNGTNIFVKQNGEEIPLDEYLRMEVRKALKEKSE